MSDERSDQLRKFSWPPSIIKNLPQSSWSEVQFHPWRRYFARVLDTSLNGGITIFCLAIMLYMIAPNFADSLLMISEQPSGKLFDTFIATFFSVFLNAAFIGCTGRSLGKFFFGIRVTDQNGMPIGYKLALKREFLILYRGFGLCIPIFSLFTLFNAYDVLKEHGKTTWDRDLSLKVSCRNNCLEQIVLGVLGFVFYGCFLIVTSNL